MSEKISAGMDFRQAEVEVDTGSPRGRMSFFLDILGSLCLVILDSIGLDWIWPFAWAYFVLVASAPAEVSPCLRATSRSSIRDSENI